MERRVGGNVDDMTTYVCDKNTIGERTGYADGIEELRT